MQKNYGLTGQTVKVHHKFGDTGYYPWNDIAVPVLIVKEYPTFFVGTVLPHYAPHGFGLSHPYNISIDKHDIQLGVLIVNGGKIR